VQDASDVDFEKIHYQPLLYFERHVHIDGRDLSHMPPNSKRSYVPGDGDCLFHAFKAANKLSSEISIKNLRDMVVKHMISHKILFSGIHFKQTDGEDFNDYLS
jgi:hypothetical protein